VSNEFDASLVCNDPLSPEVLAEQARTMEHLMQMPNALANAKLHAENDLRRLMNACNRLAWGTVACEPRGPTAEEAAVLLQRLAPEDREKLMAEARLAAAQRHLLTQMEEAQQTYLAQLQAEQDELAEREGQAIEWAEFEAYDAAGRDQLFEAWRVSRRGNS